MLFGYSAGINANQYKIVNKQFQMASEVVRGPGKSRKTVLPSVDH